MNFKITSALIIGCAIGIGTLAAAVAPVDMIAARQQNYKVIGKTNKAIADELKNASPSLPSIQANAKVIAGLAPKIPSWFPAGSGPEAGVKTGALPAIWQNNADFRTAARNFAAAAAALDATAAKGDLGQIATAQQTMGGTCKACHQQFRLKE